MREASFVCHLLFLPSQDSEEGDVMRVYVISRDSSLTELVASSTRVFVRDICFLGLSLCKIIVPNSVTICQFSRSANQHCDEMSIV